MISIGNTLIAIDAKIAPQSFENEFGTKDWGAIFASIAISVFPMLIIYMILNKTVIEGMTSGAVKG